MVDRLKSLSLKIFLVLLAYMPLHILLSTWFGTTFDLLSVARIWKDVAMIIGFAAAMVAASRHPWFSLLWKDRLFWLIATYGLLTISLAALRPTDTEAEVLGVVYNLRFLVFALYAGLLARMYDARQLRERVIKLVVLIGVLVSLFGVVQYALLPNDALQHVGYSRDNGVLPVFLIDDKPDLERAMSTLRDPNSLGSYLLILLALGLMFWWRPKLPKQLAGGLLLLAGWCLLLTFSRSAWLGALVSGFVAVAMYYRAGLLSLMAKWILPLAVTIVVAGVGLYSLRQTYLVQNITFHADESTQLEDPNQLRTRFWSESIKDIQNHPLGSGPGTAGLVSIRNEQQGVKLTENYYLQLALEVGLVGLLLFMVILAVTAQRLWLLVPREPLALALLASFMGLTFTNLLVHIWANEAVAYTWWGLAGLLLFAKPSAAKR